MERVSTETGEVEERIVGLAGFGAIKYHSFGSGGERHSNEGVVVTDGEKNLVEGNGGVMLNPEARGKGYAVEAMRLGIQWGFEQAEFGLISVTMVEGNGAMRKVMERLREVGWDGEVKNGWVDGEGGEVEINYVMRREDWKGWRG